MSARKIHWEGPARIIRADGKVEITVKDNGIGILKHLRDKIFQLFFHEANRTGNGLRLSLRYNIVKARGGEITVVTIQGGGTDLLFICRWKEF